MSTPSAAPPMPLRPDHRPRAGEGSGDAAAEARTRDGDLMARVAAGDAAALGLLYDRHAAVVHAYARRLMGEREAAEDLLQEVFFRAWRRADAYHPERGELVTWLLSMTHNLAIDEVRKRRRRPQKADGATPELVLAGVADNGPAVEDEVWRGALRGSITDALRGLPPAQRDAVALAYFGGLTQREIAHALGAPLGTIKTRLRLGLDKLRAELEQLEQTAGAA